jgi:hypothetical protein
MNIRLGLKSWATGALVLAAVTGCASGNDSPASEPQTTTSSSITTKTTVTPPSDTEVASKAAAGLVRRYYALRDHLRQHPSTPLSKLKTVATSTELKAQEALFKRERGMGLHQTGDTEISKLTVQSINLDNSDPKSGRVPTVQVDVCYDVSKVDILDRNGHSVVNSDRPDTGGIRYTVANYHWASDPKGGWRVATSQDLKQTPCPAS